MSTPPPYGIRTPRSTDREAVLDTVRAVDLLPEQGVLEVAAELDAFLSGDPAAGAWLVDVTGSGVAGVAFYVPERLTDGTWNLLMLAVHPDQQGRRRGSALVRSVELDLRARGARLLVIETSGLPSFAGQRRFYQRLGYRRQGWIDDFFEAGDAKVVQAKLLAAERADDGASPGPRAAVAADLERLLDLAVAFYAEDGFTTPPDALAANLGLLVASGEARVALVADPDTGAPVAFAVTTTCFGLENGLVAELEDLYVVPNSRRHGLGTVLVEDAAAWARGRDCATLEVVIAPNGQDVDHLHRYYAGLGFIDSGRRLRSRELA